jgi:hypothetical protein
MLRRDAPAAPPWALLLAVGLLGAGTLAACTCNGREADRAALRGDTRCTSRARVKSPDDPSYQLARILGAHATHDSLAVLFREPPATPDDLALALFPAARGKPLVDRPPPRPPPYTGRIDSGFAAHPINFPADWAADPFEDKSWQLWYQSLKWLGATDLDTSAYVVVDWVEHALHAAPPLSYTWSDYVMAVRVRTVTAFVDRYVQDSAQIDRTVLHAAAVLVLTQLLGLASDSCYAEHHNHGLTEDLALLEVLPRYPALRDASRLREHALERARRQVAESVKPDGVHRENSPGYHLLYASLVLGVLAASGSGTSAGDPEIRATAGRILAVLAQLIQPNRTLPQFGDTSNVDQTRQLSRLVKRARQLGVDRQAIAEIEWIATRGARGAQPRTVDAVFPEGGYAAFRSGWTPGDEAITAHFRTGHWSYTHYHPDDTGIEIYGFGTELILGPGSHSYDARDPFLSYELSPAAQNVLVVDDLAAVDPKPHDKARITAHGGSGDLVWVQGTHPNYQPLGVDVVRTFAYRKPDAFAVIDHVVARGGEHRYAQHFHLHPSLSAVRQAGNTVIALAADGNAPSVTFTTVDSARVELARGINEAGRVAGWHFPDKYKKEPATDVVFRRRDGRRQLSLPVLILVAAPGVAPRVPSRLSYTEEGGHLTVAWSEADGDKTITVPLPAR